MTIYLGAIVSEFVRVQSVGTRLDEFLAEWQAGHPAFADDVGTIRSAIAGAVSEGTFIPTVTGSLAGALTAVLQRHGEVGKHSAHSG